MLLAQNFTVKTSAYVIRWLAVSETGICTCGLHANTRIRMLSFNMPFSLQYVVAFPQK